MPAIREMLRTAQEQRAATWAQYRALMDSTAGQPVNAEHDAELARMDAALASQTAEVDRLERALDYETRSNEPEAEPRLTTTAPAGEERAQRDAFFRYLRTGDATGLEYRALTVGTDASGGYLVPQEFQREIISTMKQVSSVRDVARVITTASGGPLEIPTFDGTAQVGRIVAENVQVTETDPAFGIKTLDSYLYSSDMTRVPLQLLQDSAFDMEGFLREALADRVARITNQHFTTGTGTGQPDGVAAAPTVGVTLATGQTTTITSADSILDLIASVDPAYRANARFMMNDTTLAIARKWKATTNEYIWQPSVQAGVPSTLFGYPVTINQDMPVPAANAYTVLFGDFRRYYWIRDVAGFQVLVLRERFADYHQQAYLGFLRTDGTKVDMAAVKALRQSAT